MASLFYFFRKPRVLPSVESNSPPAEGSATVSATKATSASPSSDSASPSIASVASMAMSAMSVTPSPPQRRFDDGRTPTGKRKTTPPESGRTAAAVAMRWKTLNKELDRGGQGQRACIPSRPAPTSTTANGVAATSRTWTSRFNPLRLVKTETVKVKRESEEEDAKYTSGAISLRYIPERTVEEDEEDTVMVLDRIVVTGSEASSDDEEIPDSEEELETDEEVYDDDDDSGSYAPKLSATIYPHPGPPQRVMSFKGSSLDAGVDQNGEAPNGEGYGGSDSDLEDEDDDDDDEVDENWDWLFEDEPPPPTDGNGATTMPDASDYYWSVDEDERAAYEEGVAAIEGYEDAWTADEKRLHRLLSLRGFHPLLPATWTRDFLGVPMYPSLFAPTDGNEYPDDEAIPVTITNYGSQFHATKALRALFDLQSRVSGLRQTGHNTVRIGAIIERELRRYITWAAADAGLDRCGPLAAMPNIAAKQFLVGRQEGKTQTTDKKTKKTKKRSLARQVQDYFGDWVARYRAYYASLPEYNVEDNDEEGDKGSRGRRHSRLRPPRLLYGFVIVQHAVMLLVVDAAGNRSSRHPRPRCLADFNLSLGDRWLDASLNVAIPVHVARAAQLRCRAGLVLPETNVDDVDEDA